MSKKTHIVNAPFHVVSYGGSGSKMVAKSLYTAFGMSIGHRLEQFHSHWRRPPENIPRQTRLVYVFSDPRNAVISFFQRRVRRHAAHNFVPGTNLCQQDNEWVVRHLKSIEAVAPDFSADHDLSKYLEEGHDFFQLEDHLSNWLDGDISYPVLFLAYEHLWQRRDEISTFLNLPLLNFPARLRRAADWTELVTEEKLRLDRMYGGLASRLARLPGAFCRIQGEKFTLSGRHVEPL